MICAWARSKVDGKSNEITAMPALMKLMDIRGSVVTADALNCQKSIAEQIVKQGGDYVLAVKNNQPSLYEDVRLFFEDALEDGFDVAYRFCEAEDWGHGRAEVRKCWAVSVDQLEWFKHTRAGKGSPASCACRARGAPRTMRVWRTDTSSETWRLWTSRQEHSPSLERGEQASLGDGRELR